MDKSKSTLTHKRKPAEEGQKGHEAAGMMRWLLTYADMLTLLFALFVIMYAISRPQIKNLIEVQQSVAEALHGTPKSLKEVVQSVEESAAISPEEKERQIEELVTYLREHQKSPEVQELLKSNPHLKKQVNPPPVLSPLRQLQDIKGKIDHWAGENNLTGAIHAEIDKNRGLVIQLLTDGVLFELGQADLKPQAKEIIKVIVQFIKEREIGNQIRVDGHTDNLPIRGGPFRDNLDLSMARAANVWRDMVLHLGLPATQVSAAGYGEYVPLVPNNSDANRRKNRRVEITIPLGKEEKRRPQGEFTNPGKP